MLRVLLLGLTLVWVAAPLGAQPVFRSGIDLVHFGVTVLDKQGKLVPDLTANDFEVHEEGEEQVVTYFTYGVEADASTMPLHLGLLFDTSGSMEQDGAFAKTAAIKFLNSLTQAIDMTLVEFGNQVRVGRFGQADFPRLVERIRQGESEGWTALYDALGVYLDGASSQDGRKVLLLYTDGEDTRSRMGFGDTLDLLKASDVTVYAIGFQEHLSASTRMMQRMRLDRIVEQTGGICFFPDSVDALDEIYEQIRLEITGRYSIGYASTDERTDGAWRRVQIKVKTERPGLRDVKIRTRRRLLRSLQRTPPTLRVGAAPRVVRWRVVVPAAATTVATGRGSRVPADGSPLTTRIAGSNPTVDRCPPHTIASGSCPTSSCKATSAAPSRSSPKVCSGAIPTRSCWA